jgi:hypothetical protein
MVRTKECFLWVGTLPIYSVPKTMIRRARACLRRVNLGLKRLPEMERRGYVDPVLVFPLNGFKSSCTKCYTVQCEADRAFSRMKT